MTLVLVNDKMQQGYTYELSEKEGQNFATDFTPELTPQQMLEMGVFEGHYLNDCQQEFPKEWFANARLSPVCPDIKQNYFQTKSRLPLSEWQKRGWIIGPDVRGVVSVVLSLLLRSSPSGNRHHTNQALESL